MKRISDIAKDLKVSERQVGFWISTGILRAYRIGRLVFLDPVEVYEDIKRHGSATPRPGEDAGVELGDILDDDPKQR